jgi:hypothetical protein
LTKLMTRLGITNDDRRLPTADATGGDRRFPTDDRLSTVD